MRPWPCETKWGARRSPLCISSFMKNASLLSAPISACEIWQLFCTPHCEQASNSLIRNLALINLINISVSVSQAPSSVFGTAVRAWRRQGTRVNKTADSPNRKPMSPLMSASRLHFFFTTLQRKHSTKRRRARGVLQYRQDLLFGSCAMLLRGMCQIPNHQFIPMPPPPPTPTPALHRISISFQSASACISAVVN
ncbi:uncharacterized protein K444DRAFT_11930 [Hyaloscypha bicolor E]|uniref:Uncharacterized protein n=1 Tax=Hyaloscypha bicolor E TaxID=1095630 RepID=A0A2J6TWB6_9HELO|nr:uncharacterized protein K444DRAFT_11930 [Hyaloscypha bicolor E]PMD67313.1 hypothetical protein K444DRAFT_11930 [Hyaloscypha bicolor E]